MMSAFRAARLRGLSILLLAGGAWSLSFAPLAWAWVQWLSLATALYVIVPTIGAASSPSTTPWQAAQRAASLAWVYGFAMFSVGVSWLYISLHDFGDMPAVIAVAAVLALAAYMALYPAVAFGLTAAWIVGRAGRGHPRRTGDAGGPDSTSVKTELAGDVGRPDSTSADAVFTGDRPVSGWNALTGIVFAGAWTLSEWLRAVVFTGFPWLSTGEAWIDTWLAGFYPLVGSYGVAFASALIAAALTGGLFNWKSTERSSSAAAAKFGAVLPLLALPAIGWGLLQVDWGEREAGRVRVHIVQPNVSQTIKFDPEHITQNFLDTVMLGRRAAEESKPGEWLMFPETALPVIWQDAPQVWRNAFAGLAWEYQTPVVMGAALQDGPDIYSNSVIALRPDVPEAPEQPTVRYDKRHLVPFGEFIPLGFRWFVDLMNMPLGDFTRGRGAPQAFEIGDLRLLPNVCYEDVFGHEMAELVRTASQEPHILFNVSNLAWFGGSWALQQHAQMSRVRAAELRKPMVRATNTGISGIIDGRGKWVLQMPDNERFAASGPVVGLRGLTPFARFGLWVPLAFVLLTAGVVAAIVAVTGRRRTFANLRPGNVQ